MRAYITFKVRTCVRTSARPFLPRKNVWVLELCRCVRKKWGAGACAAHYENVCNVRVGADKNPHSKKVWICYMMTYFAPNLSHTQKVNTPSQERMRWRWRNYRLSIYVMYQGKQKWRNCRLNPKSPDYKIGWAILVE